MFFSSEDVTDFASAKRADTARFAAYFREMLSRGVFLAPSQYEAMFVSMAHGDAEIEATIEAATAALAALR
jgi:glutamate-1-semialdehyde 2,1-aminomutase